MGQMGGLSLQRDVILVEFMQHMPIISTPLVTSVGYQTETYFYQQ